MIKEEIKLKCAEIAYKDRSKNDLSDDICIGIAQKIYEFVMGKTKKVPSADSSSTG